MKRIYQNRAVFIDRDGTINIDVVYMHRVSDFRFYPGVKNGIKILHDAGYKIIVITNQSGIARGIITEKKLEQIHNKMKCEIENAGGHIDAIYYCPHHPDEICECRKPKTKMFERAIADLNIDVKKSFMIGDRMLDIEAGNKIGCITVLVPEKGHENRVEKELKESSIRPDFKCDSFKDAIVWIMDNKNRYR